ncbi:hypothetical protein ADUPG1_011572, partial [Aduncisulcus paluster]
MYPLIEKRIMLIQPIEEEVISTHILDNITLEYLEEADEEEFLYDDGDPQAFDDMFCVPSSESDMTTRTRDSPSQMQAEEAEIYDDDVAILESRDSRHASEAMPDFIIATFPYLFKWKNLFSHLFDGMTGFGRLLARKYLKREISETLYTEMYSELKASALLSVTGMLSKRELDTIQELFIASYTRLVKDDVELYSRSGQLVKDQDFTYYWYDINRYAIPMLLHRYFSKMTHFSPFQRIDVERWDDEPVCFQRHRKMVDLIRTKLNITRTIDLPPCETLRLFCSLSETRGIEPIIIVPVICYMDGIATARLGHTVLSLKITLGNIPIDLRNKSEAWVEITLVDESDAHAATISCLNQL